MIVQHVPPDSRDDTRHMCRGDAALDLLRKTRQDSETDHRHGRPARGVLLQDFSMSPEASVSWIRRSETWRRQTAPTHQVAPERQGLHESKAERAQYIGTAVPATNGGGRTTCPHANRGRLHLGARSKRRLPRMRQRSCVRVLSSTAARTPTEPLQRSGPAEVF